MKRSGTEDRGTDRATDAVHQSQTQVETQWISKETLARLERFGQCKSYETDGKMRHQKASQTSLGNDARCRANRTFRVWKHSSQGIIAQQRTDDAETIKTDTDTITLLFLVIATVRLNHSVKKFNALGTIEDRMIRSMPGMSHGHPGSYRRIYGLEVSPQTFRRYRPYSRFGGTMQARPWKNSIHCVFRCYSFKVRDNGW